MIYGSPFSICSEVEVAIADGGLLQVLPQALGAPRRRVVLHRFINDAAALPRLREPVKGTKRGLRQHDIDAFCHSDG